MGRIPRTIDLEGLARLGRAKLAVHKAHILLEERRIVELEDERGNVSESLSLIATTEDDDWEGPSPSFNVGRDWFGAKRSLHTLGGGVMFEILLAEMKVKESEAGA